MWLDKEAGRLGNLVLKNDKANFVTLDSDDPELNSFLVVLEKDHYGDYVLDFREFARVLPKITKSTPGLARRCTSTASPTAKKITAFAR